MGAVGRVLGAILATRWPKRPQDHSKEPAEKIKKRGLGPKIRPKSIKNGAGSGVDSHAIRIKSQMEPKVEWIHTNLEGAIRLNQKNIENMRLIHRSVVQIDGYGAFRHAGLDFPIRTARNSLPMPQNSRNLFFKIFDFYTKS